MRKPLTKLEEKRLHEIISSFMASLDQREQYLIASGLIKREMNMFVGGLRKLING